MSYCQWQEVSHYVLCPILCGRKHHIIMLFFPVLSGRRHHIMYCVLFSVTENTLCVMSYSQWQVHHIIFYVLFSMAGTSHYVLCPILSGKKHHIMCYVLFLVTKNTLCIMSYSQWQETSHYVLCPILSGRRHHIMYFILFSLAGKVTLCIISCSQWKEKLHYTLYIVHPHLPSCRKTHQMLCVFSLCV